MENSFEQRFRSTISVFALIFGILRKYSKLIILVFLLFTTYTIVSFLTSSKIYKTEMIATSSVVTSERMSVLVEPLGKLAGENNHTELALLMNLDSITASHIVDINAKEIKDENRSQSDNFESEFLRQQNCLITIKVEEPRSIMDTIQSGILYYLKNNEYIKRRSMIERNNLEFMKSRIQNEIKELDKLREKITFSKSQMSMMDPSAINNSIANLYGQELAINGKIQLEDGGINIIRNVTYFRKHIAPKLWLSLFISFFTSFIVCTIIIAFLEAKKIYSTL